MLQAIVESIFEPGVNSQLLTAINITFIKVKKKSSLYRICECVVYFMESQYYYHFNVLISVVEFLPSFLPH